MPATRVTGNSPWHVIFVLDDSGSMTGEAAAKLNEAIASMIEEMKLMSQGTKSYFKLSFIVFGSNARILSEAEGEGAIDKSKITSFKGDSGSTNMAAALTDAAALLNRQPGKTTDFEPFVFLMTDGKPDDRDAARSAAVALKAVEIAAGRPRLVTLGLGDEKNVDMEFLADIATNRELALHLKDPEAMVRFFPNIGTVVSGGSGGAAGVEQAISEIDI